jgi:hypothetical protein
MAVTVKRSDLFPVGTSVSAYPAAAAHFGLHAAGAATETHVVDAAGACGPFTTLTADQPYVLFAAVGGEQRYLEISDSDFTELGTLAERIAARRVAVGA